MEIPREHQVKYGLEPGAIFIIEKEEDKKEHFFVVLNMNPKTDSKVILVSASTVHQRYENYISRIEKRFGIGTVVHLQAEDSAIIKKDSTFDCNSIADPTVEELCTSVNYTRITRVGTLESGILEQLREATLMSPRLKKKYRKYIKDGEEE